MIKAAPVAPQLKQVGSTPEATVSSDLVKGSLQGS